MMIATAAPCFPAAPVPGRGWLAAPEMHEGGGRFAPRHAGGRERLLGKRVLIVEDEALLALELQFAFEDEGAEVIGPAMSLHKAVEAVESDDEIDAAVLDVDLGGADVYPVAELLQKRGVPFVFHTAHGSRRELATRFPAAVTCMKPTLPEALIGQLLRVAGLTGS